ncbi:tRNA uracil54-C5-methyltransferase [Hondaea fermentalgiana]|uniref:tRNA uracil54-C5-methyltransferase n=1 Tax=Hondaea fermentalgiana TaxID=2315210 RepID=A0A2R5GFN9_9STRA|nr:tRNA uracil54-C5-methyltransferase [Hondaea fermentalgiana]|eukprot:GBG29405.1 tRNA uracil54-C5-methyltransferase [Hondaea fermentalgiana]
MLAAKVRAVERLLGRAVDRVHECPCGDLGYRMKISLRVTRDKEKDGLPRFAWHEPKSKHLTFLDKSFPIAHERINKALPVVLDRIQKDPSIGHSLFETKLHTSLLGDLMISLVYRVPLTETVWSPAAEELGEAVREATGATRVNMIGRSRKQNIVLGNPYVLEKFPILDGDGVSHDFWYRQSAEEFSQPNGLMNNIMLQWAADATRLPANDRPVENDLLELYCGNGNFTSVLSKFNYEYTLASEIGRVGVKDAIWSLAKNKSHQAKVVRMSSHEMCQAFFNERQFQRLREVDLDDYLFRTIFVDPPRQGLDVGSVRILSTHQGQIIYVSCNPVTMKRDIEAIRELSPFKMEIKELVCFDQFPNTDHLELGAVIQMTPP